MCSPRVSLIVLMCFALSAFADTTGGPVLPVENKKAVAPAVPPSPADYALRTKVRKKAPFWIHDSAHGAAICLNKDGSFSSEAQGGGSTAGIWKILKGQLHIGWSDGGEQYQYPITAGKGGAILIRGKKAQGGRYQL